MSTDLNFPKAPDNAAPERSDDDVPFPRRTLEQEAGQPAILRDAEVLVPVTRGNRLVVQLDPWWVFDPQERKRHGLPRSRER